eukprot:TRINITY_DN1916_c0_g1_i1.p1 TRINITY_DN1916_c0_g1~~TRINITY_DN1916_c0_g1_i1.p1  ORF type:complete len:440 (-),score=44.40 TRINITY_DN1916_c0_g1_i1:203-1522(-)
MADVVDLLTRRLRQLEDENKNLMRDNRRIQDERDRAFQPPPIVPPPNQAPPSLPPPPQNYPPPPPPPQNAGPAPYPETPYYNRPAPGTHRPPMSHMPMPISPPPMSMPMPMPMPMPMQMPIPMPMPMPMQMPMPMPMPVAYSPIHPRPPPVVTSMIPTPSPMIPSLIPMSPARPVPPIVSRVLPAATPGSPLWNLSLAPRSIIPTTPPRAGPPVIVTQTSVTVTPPRLVSTKGFLPVGINFTPTSISMLPTTTSAIPPPSPAIVRTTYHDSPLLEASIRRIPAGSVIIDSPRVHLKPAVIKGSPLTGRSTFIESPGPRLKFSSVLGPRNEIVPVQPSSIMMVPLKYKRHRSRSPPSSVDSRSSSESGYENAPKYRKLRPALISALPPFAPSGSYRAPNPGAAIVQGPRTLPPIYIKSRRSPSKKKRKHRPREDQHSPLR